jgi:hypothetical protein
MADKDAWGSDPSVQVMRKVFHAMEQAQHAFLKRLTIAPGDQRLRQWREQALALFEKAWGVANQLGIAMDEKMAAAVYCALLARIMGTAGTVIPADFLPAGEDVRDIIKAVCA